MLSKFADMKNANPDNSYQSPVGLALTVVRALMYKLAICFEGYDATFMGSSRPMLTRCTSRMLRVLYARRAKELEQAQKKEE